MLCGSSTTQIVLRLRVELRAVQARIGIGDVVAHRAEAHVHLGVADGVGERQGFFRLGAQNMEREALRGLRPDAGQMFELVDQTLDRFGKIRHEDVFRDGVWRAGGICTQFSNCPSLSF